MRRHERIGFGAHVRLRTCTAVSLGLVALSAVGVSSVAAAPLQTARAGEAACFLPKTKFLFHAGLAFGAFHRYIYKPFKAGTFSGSGKVAAIAKAALAAAFVYHEVNEALKQVPCSHTLQVLATPLTAASSAIQAAETKLKSGGLPDIASLGSSFDALGNQAAGTGLSIKDIAHSI